MGAISATAASALVSLTTGTLAASGSCTFSVNVTGITAGTQNNTTGAVTSTEGGTGGTASASTTVVAPPSIAKAFGSPNLPLNGVTSLSFTITNPVANTVGLTGVAVTDTLPVGLVVATPNGVAGSCGAGTITAVAGASTISLSTATIPFFPGRPRAPPQACYACATVMLDLVPEPATWDSSLAGVAGVVLLLSLRRRSAATSR